MKKIRIALEKCRMMPLGQTTDGWDVLTVQNLLYEPLVRARCGQMNPALAKGWMVTDNGKRWVFYLRDEVRFSDGSECTMEDVHRSFEEMRNAKDSFGMPGPFSRYLAGLEFKVLNEKTLEITSEKPNGDVADFLSEIFIRKIPAEGMQPIGTGPYELAEYIPNELISLRKKASLNIPEAFDGLDFLIIPDADRRWQMLKSGGVDIAMDLDQLEEVPFDDPSVTFHKAVNTLSVMGFLNGYEKPFNDPKARLALNYAVDVEKMIRKVWKGLAIPSASIVSPYHCGFEHDIKPIPYDPEKAKELFARADMPDELILRTPTFMPERAPLAAECIAEDLRKIGLKVRIDVKEDRPEYAREVGRKETGHIALFDSSPHSSYRVLSDKISGRQHGLWWQGIGTDELDDMIDEAHATADVTPRQFAYAKAIRYLNENPYWIYLYHPVLVCGCNDASIDVELTHEGLMHFPGTW